MSPLQKSQSAPEIETDSARRLTTKSIKLIHAAHAKATQTIEQHIAPGYEADTKCTYNPDDTTKLPVNNVYESTATPVKLKMNIISHFHVNIMNNKEMI